jgi:transcriptional regulator with XRE-family HTH domain
MSTAAVLESLAARLKAERERQGLTLDQLAGATGLSRAYLSRLESGDRQPPIATLLTLAQALGVRVGALLGEDEGAPSLAVHLPSGRSYESNGLSITTASGYTGSRELDALRIAIPADRPAAPFAQHRGEEWLHVLLGIVRLEYGADIVLLEPGTSAHFDASTPHRLSTPQGDAELLLVASASRQSLPQSAH